MDTYLYLCSKDSIDLFEENDPSECWIQLPRPVTLDGHWTCALIDVALDCDFKPRSSRLYLCCDFLKESYVRNTSLPVLRNIEVNTRYKKLKTESYPVPLYVPVKTTHLHTLKLRLLDENLDPVTFNSNDFHCVLHLKQTWDP